MESQIKHLINQHYALGEVNHIRQIFGGYVNLSFEINAETGRYFFRQYKTGIKESEIQFEHKLIQHLVEKNFKKVARIIPTHLDKSYVEDNNRFFTVFDYLFGEDEYTWDNPPREEKTIQSAAETLALFHQASSDFNPGTFKRTEPEIMELMSMLPRLVSSFRGLAKQSRFDKYFLENYSLILKNIEDNTIPWQAIAKMPRIAIHGDYHPGNLKYQDNQVVGVFDLDWSKMDFRICDVALAIYYFCTYWKWKQDGELLSDKVQLFLNAYQNKSPLTKEEFQYLPNFLNMANLYLLRWTLTTYYSDKSLNVYEYLYYLQHSIRFMSGPFKHFSR